MRQFFPRFRDYTLHSEHIPYLDKSALRRADRICGIYCGLAKMLRRNKDPADVQCISLQKKDGSADDLSFFCQFIQMPLSCHLRIK